MDPFSQFLNAQKDNLSNLQNRFREALCLITPPMRRTLIVLIIGLMNGLIFVWVVPLWQHYDEPAHFEYAWLIANRLKLPKPGDYDQGMRLAVDKSLIATHFFRGMDAPNLTDPSQPLWIGITQLTDPPLYSIIEAIPLYFLRGSPVDLQLHVGRMASLLFFLLTIFCACELVDELTPENHPLRWMIPLFIALLPGLAEFMSAINDIGAAIGLASLWYLLAIRLIKRFTYRDTIFITALTIAGYFTQKILYPLFIYLPLILILSILPKKLKYLGWVAAAMIAIVGLFASMGWGESAFWLRNNYQNFPSRVQTNQNQVKYALKGQMVPDSGWGQGDPPWNPGFFQILPYDEGLSLRGKTVTIGAWMWADQKVRAYGPAINSLINFNNQWAGFNLIPIGQDPRFVTEVVQIPADAQRVQVWLRVTTPDNQYPIIYFSDVVVVDGVISTRNPPVFSDSSGSAGTWGGQAFSNHVRNGRFNQSWPYMRSQVFRIITSKITDLNPMHISSVISLFFDIPGTAWYWQQTGSTIFNSFWGKFAWGQVPLVASKFLPDPYLLFWIITLIGIPGSIGFGISLARSQKHEFAFLLTTVLVTILLAVIYGVYTMGGALRFRAFIPNARYIFPAILPISFLLVPGWQGILSWTAKLVRLNPRFVSIVFSGLMACLDFYAIISILVYFNAVN